MNVTDPGHSYLLHGLDGAVPQRLTFVKRVGPNYPGNVHGHPGLLTQEVIRALIDRCKYMRNQGACVETDVIIDSLRTALYAFEVRAARCRGHAITLDTLVDIELIPICPTCGHIQCDQTRHEKPHWSETNPEARGKEDERERRFMAAGLCWCGCNPGFCPH